MGRILVCNTDSRDADRGCLIWDDGDTTATDNGWHGFDGLGQKDEDGWSYLCDGMPRETGCGTETVRKRPWATVGTKGGGWVVCYGTSDDGKGWDLDVVLTFCPECVAHQTEHGHPITQPPAEHLGGER